MTTLEDIKRLVAKSAGFESWKSYNYVLPDQSAEALAKELALMVGNKIVEESAKRVECLDVIPEIITNIDVKSFIP